MRKIIISRKGVESENGEMASAFVSGGMMASIPIPGRGPADLIRYDQIRVEGMRMDERIKLLRRNRKKPFLHECCHHDPDLIRDARPRPPGNWRGIFGQSGKEQDDLAEVDKGDLFLFFGLFQEAGQVNGKFGLMPGAREFHAFFGYLQVGERFHVQTDQKIPEKYGCFSDHPHLTPERLKCQGGGGYADNNTVYIADESFSLDSKFRGWGVFRFAPELILTKEWRTPAYWLLPDFLQGKRIGHRPRHDAWKNPDGAFRSPDVGHQEIVMDADDKLKEWALGIIRAGMRED